MAFYASNKRDVAVLTGAVDGALSGLVVVTYVLGEVLLDCSSPRLSCLIDICYLLIITCFFSQMIVAALKCTHQYSCRVKCLAKKLYSNIITEKIF